MSTRTGGLRSSLSRWASQTSRDDEELRATSVKSGCCPVAEAENRRPVVLRGVLRTVTLRPRGGVPALEAELYDGTGVVTVVWLGRRRICGIEPGQTVQVSGRIGLQDHDRVMYNPRYELVA